MLNDIHLRSKPVGLNMHLGKTKVMLNPYTSSAPIIVDGKTIEEVESYIYLGKVVTKDGDLLPEVKRRIATGVGSFWKGEQHHEKPQSKYDSETWALTLNQSELLAVIQRKRADHAGHHTAKQRDKHLDPPTNWSDRY